MLKPPMPLRNSFKYQDIAKILQYYGCYEATQGKGSHKKRYSPITDQYFPIPLHGSSEIREGTLFAILKQSGISKQQVLEYINRR